MKYSTRYLLCEDGFWETRLSIRDADDFILADLAFYAPEKVPANILMSLKRSAAAILKSVGKLEGA